MTHVLLVDGGDEQPPVEKALRSAEGFSVDRVRQAETVLEEKGNLFSENGRPGPDLMVSSWFLPRLNGPSLTEKLREAGADVPILLLASQGGAEARAEALRRGADDCLT